MRPLAGLALALLVAAGACAREDRELSPGGFVGAEMPTPRPKPDFVLTTTDGRPFDFRRETEGYVTLLFYGYTHCPDVCPLHMANIAAVLEKLPPKVARRVKVVFVAVDPLRDTPARTREWLDNFSREFIGLVGTADEVAAAMKATRLPPPVIERAVGADTTKPPSPDEPYTMAHAAQVLAYTTDNLMRVMYPFGTRQQDWAHDIPRLVAFTGGGGR